MPGSNIFGPHGPGINEVTDRPTQTDSNSGTDSWFGPCVNGDPNTGTKISYRWLNFVTANLRRAVRGMGVAVSETDDDSILKAILKAIRNAGNIGGAIGIYKDTDPGTQTHRFRSLEGAGGIAVTISAGAGDKIIIDGSGIVVSGLAPFFPEVETANGKLSVTTGAAQVVIGSAQTFVHRGTRRINCADYAAGLRTFATVANKTYHLRWRWNNGAPAFAMLDLANAGYNPGALAETDEAFDTSHDDMLIAKVETNGANGITLTTLINKDRYYLEGTHMWDNGASAGSVWQDDTAPESWSQGVDFTLNFARRIQAGIVGLTDCTITGGTEYAGLAVGKSRYKIHIAHTTSGNPQGRFLRYFARM